MGHKREDILTCPECGASFKRSAHVTQREKEIAILAAKGLENKEIAAKLNLSPDTISAHRHSLYRKLKVRNVAQLVHRVITLGWLRFDVDSET